MRHAESRIQSTCVSWFKLCYREYAKLFFSIPNGVCTSATQGRILKAEGMLAGVADTFLALPRDSFAGMFIEFKQAVTTWKGGKPTTTKTYQRAEQKEFQAAVEAVGYRYEIVRTFDEFKALIDEYINGKH